MLFRAGICESHALLLGGGEVGALTQTASYQSTSAEMLQQPPQVQRARLFYDPNVLNCAQPAQQLPSASRAAGYSAIDIPFTCSGTGFGGGNCAAEAGQAQDQQPQAATWLPLPTMKLRGMARQQRIELTGALARPLVHGALGSGVVIAVLFLIFISLHLIGII